MATWLVLALLATATVVGDGRLETSTGSISRSGAYTSLPNYYDHLTIIAAIATPTQNADTDDSGDPISKTARPQDQRTTEDQAQFTQGLRDAGASKEIAARFFGMVPCESEWRSAVVNLAGPYYGLLQFLRSTWDAVASHTGFWDIFDPYSQGFNGWTLIDPSGPENLRANPAGQWPVCWFV